MKTEQLIELHEKTLKVINLRGHLDDYKESIGISKESLGNNLVNAEYELSLFVSGLSPTCEEYDSVVFTLNTGEPIMVVEGMDTQYLGVPVDKIEEEGRINVRVSIREI